MSRVRPEGTDAGDETEAPTRPTAVDGDAPTLPAGSADQAPQADTDPTRLQIPDTDDLATRQAGSGDLPPTRLTDRHQAGDDTSRTLMAIGSGSYSATGTGVLGPDGRSVSIRTRTNEQLPAEVQRLDQSLQLSRRSVFVDMIDNTVEVPDLVRRRLHGQDTVGRYVVRKPLAAGGMGAVLAIDDHDFQRRAAMKVMHSRFATRPEALERFLEEAQVTAQLEHPNIVPIHDLGVTGDGTLYYTMKLIQGRSLGDIVKALRAGDAATRARWTEEYLLLTFLKVLDGLGYAHERGVVHRDIKPDNIMVEEHGEVLIVDWGIAKVLGEGQEREQDGSVVSIRDEQAASATLDGSVMGTPHYMPPEQADGRLAEIDRRSDIYALGVTLYELLALQRPYPKTGDLHALIALVLEGRTIPLSEAAPHLHQDLVAVVHKAMAHDRLRRYEDCSAFAADLRAYLAGQAVAARRRNLIERFGAWLSRHRRQVLAVSALILVAVVTAAGAMAWTRSQRQAEGRIQLQQARDALAAIDPAATLDDRTAQLEGVAAQAQAARALLPEDPAAAALRDTVLERQGALASQRRLAEEQARRAAAARANDERAATLLSAARQQQDAGAFDEALEGIKAAAAIAEAAPLQLTIRDAQRTLEALLADRVAAERQAAARGDLAAAREQVALLETALVGLPSVDGELLWRQDGRAPEHTAAHAAAADAAAAAQVALERARSRAVAVEGLDEVTGMLARASQRLADEQGWLATWQQRHRDSVAAAARAADLLAAADVGDEAGLSAARDAAITANGLLAANRDALTILGESERRLAELARRRDLRVAREARQAKAHEALARAEAGAAQLASLDAQADEVEARISALQDSLRDAALDARQPLWRAHDELAATNQALARRRPEVEADALEVLDLLAAEEDRDQAEAIAARRLLADLAMERYRAALAEQDLVGIATWRGQVQRYDSEQRYRLAISDQARLSIAGSGTVTVTPVRLHLARFQADEDAAQELTLPLEAHPLPAGRWRIVSDLVSIDWEFAPGQEQRLHLPERKPALSLPDGEVIELAYVPAVDGGRGFWLGETEISHAQYAAFITAPTQWRSIERAFAALIGKSGRPDLPLVPHNHREDLVPGRNWPQVIDDEAIARERLRGYVLPKAIRDWPVSGLTRADAQAFCIWLAGTSGHSVRLPTLPEWRQAAGGGDVQRVYPWGEIFDPAFVDGHRSGREQPVAVASVAADRGPFGHRDLAGSVREWVLGDEGDALGSFDAVVAGGSWLDSQPDQFRIRFAEAIPATTAMAQIGFRILVEDE